MKTTKSKSIQHNRNVFRITKQTPVQLSVVSSPFVIKKVAEPVQVKRERSSMQQEQNENQKSAVQEYIDYVHSLDKLTSKSASETPDINEMPGVYKNYFSFEYMIGTGGFGKVWRVEAKKSHTYYAMKEMSKAKVITKRSVNSVMNERKLLAQLKNAFLVNMVYAFQDRDNLYLVMDLMTGGDLRYHIGRMRRFNEEQTKFFVACVMIGLEYLHLNGILHRDIKPENLVLDNRGYVRITDLGIARQWRPDNAEDTSGTPGYMAPEVMCRQNHGVAVDYFALGVMAYEFMMGRRPYSGKSRKEIRDNILAKQVQIKEQDIPPGWSLEAADFVNRLIQRKPANRLGCNGPGEVKTHPWLKGFNWPKMYRKELEAPYIPSQKQDNFDTRQINMNTVDDATAELIKQNALLLRRNSVQNLFQGYQYDSTLKEVKDAKNAGTSSKSKQIPTKSGSSLNTTQTITNSTNYSKDSGI